jgi:hypothetical protein
MKDTLSETPIRCESDIVVAVQPGIKSMAKGLGVVCLYESRLGEVLAKRSEDCTVLAP